MSYHVTLNPGPIYSVSVDVDSSFALAYAIEAKEDAAATAAALLDSTGLTRAQMVARIAGGFVPVNGTVYILSGLSYIGQTGATAIPDLPGLVPNGQIRADHFQPNANGAVTINQAVAYADSIGGEEVWIYGNWEVDFTGTFQTDNGDDNACVRVSTANPVTLCGLKWLSRIAQTGTRIAHTVAFGGRVDNRNIAKSGGIDGLIIEGNRTTAVSEGVSFEGGIGIYVAAVDADAGPTAVTGVTVSNCIVRNTWAYGIGFQRAAWNKCRVRDCLVEDTGNDGIDCKMDWPAIAGAAGDNWVERCTIRRFALRWASLIGQKAGCDLRLGWNADKVYVEMTVPAVGMRFQVQDPGVNPADPDLTLFRHQVSNCKVISSGTKTGNDSGGTAMEAFAYQFSADFPQAANLEAEGARINYWMRCTNGSFSNLLGRNAVTTNLAVFATASGPANDNTFFGAEMTGGGSNDVRVFGSEANALRNEFHGLTCGVMQLDAQAVETGVYGGRQTTFTDSGTGNLRISASHIGAFRAGRQNDQHILMTGDGSANVMRGVSNPAAPKPFLIEADADSTDLRLNTAAAVGRVVLEVQGTDVLVVNDPSDVRLYVTEAASAPTGSKRLWVDTSAGRVLKVTA
jgi:hypothetical protein